MQDAVVRKVIGFLKPNITIQIINQYLKYPLNGIPAQVSSGSRRHLVRGSVRGCGT